MYEAFFGFRRRPFPAVPDQQFYFAAEALEQAKANVLRAVERAEGVALVVGPAGIGKSLLCNLVADHFRSTFQIAMLSSARLCSRRALLQNILFELKLPYRDMEEGELRLSLIDHLEPSDRCPNGMLLVVDEAHTLPLRLLEEIRMITNLVRGGQPRVRLVLAGDLLLEERLAMPRLASFQQRIAVRNYLSHLSQSETASFVRHQLQVAGSRKSEIFDDAALVALHHATDGVPRLINQVCDHALVLACAGGNRQVTARGIEEAWADLQQLPAPSAKPAANAPPSTIIEFGELNDGQPSEWRDFEEQFSDGAEFVEPVGSPAVYRHEQHPFASEATDQLDWDDRRERQPVAAPRAADPFGGQFADEEVIVDRYAAWDNELSRRPRVSSSDSAQIAAALHRLHHESREPVEDSLANSVQEMRHAAQQVIAPNDPPDTLLDTQRLVIAPQIVGGFGQWDEQWWTAQVSAPSSSENWHRDDRDMLIIDDGLPPAPNDENVGRPVRQEYRNLFGQLRGSH